MDAKLRSLLQKVKKEHDDDAVDRIIYATTVYILGFFSILIMAKQYVGDPLQCWVPAEYTSAWESYIENFCFVENTYFVNNTIPVLQSERKQYELRYYQWIPYLLSIQALLCYAPKLIFKLLYSFSAGLSGVQAELWNGGTNWLKNCHKVVARLHFDWYLTSIYLLMKMLFIGVLVAQLFIMNFFVVSSGFLHFSWGFDILLGMVNGQDWRTTGLFPRVTFCDLKTRDVGQSREHTVQCVLMINMFAEKIYVFLWIWIYGLLIITSINLLSWLYRSLSMQSKVRMVRDALLLHHVKPANAEIRSFITKFLKLDGIFVLRLIDSNAGYVHMADILFELWKNFGEHKFQPGLELGGNNEKAPLYIKMSSIVNKLIGKLKPGHDDDFVDKANYVYTALMLGLCAMTIAGKQYVGQPIQCWIPAEFKDSWETYAENYCFVANTYFVYMNEDFPNDFEARRDREIAYYQWVPILLATQMLGCFLPKLVFSSLNCNIGYSVEKLTNAVSLFEKDKEYKLKPNEEKDRKKAGAYINKLFTQRNAQVRKVPQGKLGLITTSLYRSGSTKFYLLYKLMNLINSIGQIFFLNRLLWPNYDLWGYGFLKDLINNRQWKESGEFPRVSLRPIKLVMLVQVTFCDIEIREIAAKPIRHTIQCVLMINMFNEKVYVFVWFWLLGLSFLNACNLLYWIWCTHYAANLTGFIKRHLSDKNFTKNMSADLATFINEYLYVDGVTTLRLLCSNCGECETAKMVNYLWEKFKTLEDKKETLRRKKDLDSSLSDEEINPDCGLYLPNNLMTQSTCTTNTTATGASSLDSPYSNVSTLHALHQRIVNFPMSNV